MLKRCILQDQTFLLEFIIGHAAFLVDAYALSCQTLFNLSLITSVCLMIADGIASISNTWLTMLLRLLVNIAQVVINLLLNILQHNVISQHLCNLL